MERHTFFCDDCSAIVHIIASNRSAYTKAFCYGQDDEEPLIGSHKEREMRMIGSKPLEQPESVR